MDDKRNFLDRLAGPPASREPGQDEAEDDDVLTLTAYALIRGVRPNVPMLELRAKAGNATALDYGWLMRADFDPSGRITLHFDKVLVAIEGRNLRPLFDGITRRKVLWVQEEDRLVAAATPGPGARVTAIRISQQGERPDGD